MLEAGVEMNSIRDIIAQVQEFAGASALNAVAMWAAAIALATTPIAFAILGTQKWFQARRGRTLQRPAFGTVVVATMLVMGIPAIALTLMVKSQYFDKDRYEFDPNRSLSVLDQGRQYEARNVLESAYKADEAVRAEMERLASERKELVENVKKLDEALLALGAVAPQSPAVVQVMPRVIENMGGVRKAVGIDAPHQWDEVIARLNEPPPVTTTVMAANVPAVPVAKAGNGLTQAEFDLELSSVPGPQKPLAALLPLSDVPTGWAVGKLGDKHLETFNAANLYDKIDGRAESFVQYDVQGMAYANFHPGDDDSNEVQLYIFEMSDPLKAFGKYGSEKPPNVEDVAVGEEGYTTAGSVMFHQGKYYTQIVSTSDDPKFAEFSLALARTVADRIHPGASSKSAGAATEAVAEKAAAATPTALFKLLPDGPNKDRPQYIAQDVFGYSFLSDVFMADYKEGDITWQGFLRPFESPEAARKVFDQYVETAKADGAEIKTLEAEGADEMIVSSNIGLFDVVYLKGNTLAGANGATEAKPAEDFARQFAKNLPAKVPTIGTAPAANRQEIEGEPEN